MEIVSVVSKLGVPDDRLKPAVVPEGGPEADRLTVLVNPAMDETETVTLVDSPCLTDTDTGLIPTLKSGATAAGADGTLEPETT